MNVISEYFAEIKLISTPEDLCSQTNFFFKGKNEQVYLLSHKPEPEPLNIVESDKYDIAFWYKRFSVLTIVGDKNVFEDDSFLYFFSSINFIKEDIFIFIVDKQSALAKEVLPLWQLVFNLLQLQNFTILEKLQTEYGNLISQLLHDVTSLMELNKSNEQEVLEKIEYQKKVNRNLLFYVRGLDLFKSSIAIKDLLRDSLALIGINLQDINVHFENPSLSIYIDVELVSTAINEIVKNALHYTNNNYSRITISINSQKSHSPFLKHKWLVIEINDQGSGIPEDFIHYIKNPFFTTTKQIGFTGFGLANAEKIIRAHNGKIGVTSKEGTNINLFIPQLTYD